MVLTIGVNNGSGQFDGTIQYGAVTKVGAGIQVLTGNNTYAGGTVVNGGTLAVFPAGGSGSVVGTGPVTVNSGATLITGGDGPLGPNNNPVGLTVNGGVVNNSANLYLGPVQMTGGTITGGNWIFPSSTITTYAAPTTAQIDLIFDQPLCRPGPQQLFS